MTFQELLAQRVIDRGGNTSELVVRGIALPERTWELVRGIVRRERAKGNLISENDVADIAIELALEQIEPKGAL